MHDMNVAERSGDFRWSFVLFSDYIVFSNAINDWENFTAGRSSL